MFRLFLILKSKSKKTDLTFIGKRTPLWKPLMFLLPSLALILFIMIIPLITTSQKAFSVAANSHKVGNTHLGFDHFTKMFNDVYFKKALSNSLLYAVLVVPISITISIVISVAISNLINKKVRSSAQTLFFIPYVTSIIAISMSFMFLFSTTGIINNIFNIKVNWLTNTDQNSHSAFIVILVQGVWSSLAFQILIFTTAILGINKDRYKAASIDGAGPVKQFFSITLPSIRRTLSFIITVGLIGAIKVFPLALFNNSASDAQTHGGATLMIFIYKNVSPSGGAPDFSLAASASLFLVIIAIAFNIFVKSLIRSVSWLFTKGGEIHVKNKIKASKI